MLFPIMSTSRQRSTVYRSLPSEVARGSAASASYRGDRVLLLVFAATGLLPLSGVWLREDVPAWQLGLGTLFTLAPLVELFRDRGSRCAARETSGSEGDLHAELDDAVGR